MPGVDVLSAWNLNAPAILLFLAIALTYVRGWLRSRGSGEKLAAFIAGLLVLFFALESPLDVWAGFFLWVHMTQHILLMTIAPLLLVAGLPHGTLLRGLPADFVRETLGPFYRWKALRKTIRWLTFPVVSFPVFASSMLLWHLPRFYELALRSPAWHNVEHACFFWSGVLFWWSVVNGHPWAPRWFAIPYLLLADIVNTAFSAFLIFSGRVLYPAYETAHIGSMSAITDQTIAGALMWVPGSMFFLVPAIAIAYRQLSTEMQRGERVRNAKRGPALRAFDLRVLRRFGRPLMMVAGAAVMVAGFTGSETAAAWTWFDWRALSLFALLVAGNLFCMTCPLTLARDLARKVVTPRAAWPVFLRNKWLGAVLIVVYLWAYNAFSLWNRPAATAWIVAAYFIAILIVDCTFTGAAFCKYVCPVGQFNFVASTISSREIGVRDRAVCASCRTHDCIRGNVQSRGCELGLFQPAKAGNLDCTFCLDCVTACPSSNAGYVQISRFSTITRAQRTDVTVLAAAVVFGAFVNAAGMIEMSWPVRVASMAVLIVAMAFGFREKRRPARRYLLSLAPIGIATWAAHLLYHVAPAALSARSVRELQIVILDAGVLMSIAAIWKIANRRALAAPWAALALLLYCSGIWIIFQPMKMVGMSM